MNHIDTNEELDRLIIASKQTERRRRNVAITIAVAAVAIVAAVVAWWPVVYQPDAVPEPAEPTVKLNASEQLAADFVAAYFAFDRDLAASFLADDARLQLGRTLGPEGWVRDNRQTEAAGVQAIIEGCYQTQELTPEGARVGCLFTRHGFGSDQLGRGPYPDNHFEVKIKNGQVVDAWINWADQRNGFDVEMYEPVSAWIGAAHPEDIPILSNWSDPNATEAEFNESLALWKQRAKDYVAAVKAGEAD